MRYRLLKELPVEVAMSLIYAWVHFDPFYDKYLYDWAMDVGDRDILREYYKNFFKGIPITKERIENWQWVRLIGDREYFLLMFLGESILRDTTTT